MTKGASRPLLIGLTGNIGTGKSTVARVLAELGAEAIDADKVAHERRRPCPRSNCQSLRARGAGPRR
jgi:dephospho-CoA kinase